MRTTRLEIDINKFQNNINKIKEYVNGKELMPVIKANAYGTHLNYKKELLKQFSIVAVAMVEEGIVLRKNGYDGEIFVLNQPATAEIEDIEAYNLTIGLSELTFIEECIKKNSSFKVHLEIETGMNRTGIKIENLDQYINLIKNTNLEIEGIYTHLSSADFDADYTNKQIKTFEKALEIIKQHHISLKYIHVNASNGILNRPLPFTNLVRPGLLLYGYEPYIGAFSKIKLEPIETFKTTVTFIKECHEGDAISYSQTYKCKKDTLVATIPIGYADGYRRCLSNKGYVFVNGKRANIIGNVCMDSCMIDVTGIKVKVGDEVILWDKDNITVEEIAGLCDTINYEILSTVSDRVPRVFIGE